MNEKKAYFRDFKDSIIPTELDLGGRFCARPFDHVEIMHGHGPDQLLGFGDVYVCCSGWLNKKIGNYLEQDLATIWNSPEAQDIRQSILDGSFRYCNKQVCPLIQSNDLYSNNNLPSRYQGIVANQQTVLESLPTSFFLCYDRSCNLACKSCRNGLVFFTEGPGKENPQKLNQKLLADLFSKPSTRTINLKITGSGDPFASVAFKDLLESLNGQDFPGLEIELYTNGLLLTPGNWDRLKHIHQNIKFVSVSIDAATAPTYQQVRGGHWHQLMVNLDFVAELRRQNKIKDFTTNFVVQTNNFFEAADFVRLCKSKNVDQINFSFVSDWATWSAAEFQAQCIWKKDHPLFPKLLEVLRDPIFADPIVALGPLRAYRDASRLDL